jgi:hypothetical protein
MLIVRKEWRSVYRQPGEEKMQRENYLMRSFINLHVIFVRPCIVIYSCSTNNKMHLLSQFIYSCKTLYMFRTVFPSIIRSSKTAYTAAVYFKQLLLSGMRWNCTSISSPIAAAVWHIPLLYKQFWAPDVGRKNRPKHVERFTRINNLR